MKEIKNFRFWIGNFEYLFYSIIKSLCPAHSKCPDKLFAPHFPLRYSKIENPKSKIFKGKVLDHCIYLACSETVCHFDQKFAFQ